MEKSEQNSITSFSKDYDYRKYVKLSIEWNRWILKPIGVWPISPNISIFKLYLRRLTKAISYGLISFLLILCAMYTILDVEDVYGKLKFCGPMSFFVMAILKYLSLNLHQNDICECVKRIEWDWKNVRCYEDRDIMIMNANFGRRLVTICTFFMYSGFAFYYIAVPVSIGTITVEDDNLTFIPLIYPFSRYVMDTRHSPTNEILFSLQVLAGALVHSISVSACSLTAVFAAHACGQMEVLACWLRHLINGRSDMCINVDVRITNVVSQHVRVLTFLSHVEKTIRQISFVEVMGSTLNLCLLGYYVVTEWNAKDLTSVVTYVVLLMSLTFNIFIFCYIGELVAEQCKKIGEVSYMIDWYQLTGKRKLCIILIIAMSNSSIKLTAGNMLMLSLSTFSDVIKSSIVYMNILLSLA